MIDEQITNASPENDGSAPIEAAPQAAVVDKQAEISPSGAETTQPVKEPALVNRDTAFKEAGEWKKKYRSIEKKMQELESRYSTGLEQLLQQRQETPKTAQGPQLAPDQQKALDDLADYLLNNPEYRSRYGLDKAQVLEEKLQRMEENERFSSFDKEASTTIDKYSKVWGLDPREMEIEVADYIEQHNIPYSKGAYERAVQNCYFERQTELQRQAANLAIIQQQKKLKGANPEGPSGGQKSSGKPQEKNMEMFLERRAREMAGESGILR